MKLANLRQTILSAAASVGSDGKGEGGLLGYVDSLAAHKDPKVAAQGRALRERRKANPIQPHASMSMKRPVSRARRNRLENTQAGNSPKVCQAIRAARSASLSRSPS